MKTPPQSWKGWGELRASQACAPDQMSFPLPPTSISSPAPSSIFSSPSSPSLCCCCPSSFSSSHLPADTTGNPQSPTPALSFYLCPTLLTFSSGYPDGVSLPTSITLSLVFFFLPVADRPSSLPAKPQPNTAWGRSQ